MKPVFGWKEWKGKIVLYYGSTGYIRMALVVQEIVMHYKWAGMIYCVCLHTNMCSGYEPQEVNIVRQYCTDTVRGDYMYGLYAMQLRGTEIQVNDGNKTIHM